MIFIYTHPIEKNLCIVIGAPKSHIEKNIGSITDEQYEKLVRDTCHPEATDITKIKEENIPVHLEEFRESWQHIGNGKIIVNLEKAKEIRLSQIRKNIDAKIKDLEKFYVLPSLKKELDNYKKILLGRTSKLESLIPSSIEDINNASPNLDDLNF